jgi:hypothetical protein
MSIILLVYNRTELYYVSLNRYVLYIVQSDSLDTMAFTLTSLDEARAFARQVASHLKQQPIGLGQTAAEIAKEIGAQKEDVTAALWAGASSIDFTWRSVSQSGSERFECAHADRLPIERGNGWRLMRLDCGG